MKTFKKIGLLCITIVSTAILAIVPTTNAKITHAIPNSVPTSGRGVGPNEGYRRIYFEPSTQWRSDSARFALKVRNTDDSLISWYDLTRINSITDRYVYYADYNTTKYTHVNFCRMNGSTSTNSDTNRWNSSDKFEARYHFDKLSKMNSSSWEGSIFSNGGSVSDMQFAVSLEVDDVITYTDNLTSGNSFADLDTKFIPTKEGNVFDGWAYLGGELAKDYKIWIDTTLMATWTATPTSNVYFYSDLQLYSETVVVQGTAVSRPVDPLKAGYQFDGWFLDDTLYDFDTLVMDTLTLVAKWHYIGISTNTYIRTYFYNDVLWSEVCIWAWESGGINYTGGIWPGVPANRIDDTDYYYFDLPVGVSVIYNDGKTEGTRYQTENATVPADGTNILVKNGDSYLQDNANRYPVKWVTSLDDTGIDFNLNVKFQMAKKENVADVRILSTLGLFVDTEGDGINTIEPLELGDIAELGFIILDPINIKQTAKTVQVVYRSVTANGNEVSANALGAQYVFAIVVQNVAEEQQFAVTPYGILDDGTRIFGATKTFVVMPSEL